MNCVLRNIPVKQEYSNWLSVLQGYMHTHTQGIRTLLIELWELWGPDRNVRLMKCK